MFSLKRLHMDLTAPKKSKIFVPFFFLVMKIHSLWYSLQFCFSSFLHLRTKQEQVYISNVLYNHYTITIAKPISIRTFTMKDDVQNIRAGEWLMRCFT